MKNLLCTLLTMVALICNGQTPESSTQDNLIARILKEPSSEEIHDVLTRLRQLDLTPKEVTLHDTIVLSNSNRLHVISHRIENNVHYGAVIVPSSKNAKKLPVIIFATGGDGIHKDFDITQDFYHPAAKFPSFLGEALDKKFIVVIPSFRGQQLIVPEKRYQSQGNIADAFGGATTDALAFLNVALKTFAQADRKRIAIYGGSRGGTVALLAAARDKRIKRAIAVAAPTDMRALYKLYPDQFKLLFFNDLLSGKITEDKARLKFISISPIHFVSELPLTQLHHDTNDPFVPVDFAHRLIAAANTNSKQIESFFYNKGIHGLWSDKNFWDRVQEFLIPLSK